MAQHTVLVVEDDASIRSLIAELLDDAGYRVLEADCGKMALSLAREHAPSVALVDYMLPDMSGLDVLERLRTQRESRHIPVMLVSGRAHQLVDRQHGADGVLMKPFDINVLLDRVDALASHTSVGGV
ncbi:MAG TPA: response regulator [Chloroflexota bacterium]|nr:response regulator [Chloroflexota bacterium]